MGAGGSKSEADVQALAQSNVQFQPPLGPPNPDNTQVYLDLQLGRYGAGTPLGRVVIELKEDVTPRTAENFKQLCLSQDVGKGYKMSRFHRIIPGFMCQGGDFTNDNGTGGRSIYGNRFPDENFTLTHTGEGILSMANAGPNTNGSQFFICVTPTPFLDGKHTVFGQVVEGYSVIKAAEACGSRSGDTAYDVMIADCGVMASAGGAPSRKRVAGGGVSGRSSATAAAARHLGATAAVARRAALSGPRRARPAMRAASAGLSRLAML